MFIKYIMQSTIQKIEYDCPSMDSPDGSIRTPHYIPIDISVPQRTPYYIIICLFDQMFDD